MEDGHCVRKRASTHHLEFVRFWVRADWEENALPCRLPVPLSVHGWTRTSRFCMRMLPASSSFPAVAFVATGLEDYTGRSLGCLVFSAFVFFYHSYLANVTDNKNLEAVCCDSMPFARQAEKPGSHLLPRRIF